MSGFVDKMRLKEMAEEDVWFARRDRELAEALRRRREGPTLERVVSGGQSGVDRAALDAALAAGLPVGGWCPLGRRAEDGTIPECYPLVETPSAAYAQRTEWNVRDADATLILAAGDLTGGTRMTADLARSYGRPCLAVDPADPGRREEVRRWLAEHRVRVLNVAGPRESGAPGIQARARGFLEELFHGVATERPGEDGTN